ncbi:TetR family transcriptional regulator [Actinomadura craniellae]|uniref:TetR family transcriptional regulator n=1 Tax=Actinomadura craniellae TaxID=2231787 RepID=A0A365GWB0_9ACTN|nr:TetR/AcrR family transcriptional regulator [Actinomadura craniellae]RAY11100.1 TetR family transcriptional regulator [Actinomadura craniellae]
MPPEPTEAIEQTDPTPRPREPLTRERIIETALHIVDSQGLSRLTMRRLGDALEVEAMAIYHHLPRGKEELLDGLVAHVGIRPARPAGPDGWRPALADWAALYRARLTEHAGVLPLLVTRRNPAALSGTAASVQEVLRAAGFAEEAAGTGAHALLGYVLGHAALEARGGARAADPEGAVDWDARFTAGLGIVLAGIAGL